MSVKILRCIDDNACTIKNYVAGCHKNNNTVTQKDIDGLNFVISILQDLTNVLTPNDHLPIFRVNECCTRVYSLRAKSKEELEKDINQFCDGDNLISDWLYSEEFIDQTGCSVVKTNN